MKSRTRLVVALGLFALASRAAGAQSLKDFVAWAAMMSTPYGSLPPVVTPAMTGRAARAGSGNVFELRYGRYAFNGSPDAVHTGGVGARFGRVGVVVGYEGCSGCGGDIIGGVDYDATVFSRLLSANGGSSYFSIGLRPAFGVGRSTGSGSNATLFSATVDVPFAVAVPVGQSARVVPFVSPGFGLGSARGGGESETGTRGSIGFGAGVVDLAPGLAFNLSWRKIFLDQAPTTIGVGLTFGH